MIDIKVYAVAFEKKGIKIDKVNKSIILTKLFYHIFEKSDGIIPSNISADLNFFNREKVNRFLLQKFEKTIIVEDKNKSKKPSMECHFSQISEEVYKKIKIDPKNMIISINHLNSRNFEELQALDLVSGSIYQSIENNNNEYIECLLGGKNLKLDVTLFKRTK